MNFEGSLTFVTDWINNSLGLNNPIIGEAIVSSIIFILFIILGWIVYNIFERYFLRWAKKTKSKLDDEILKNVKRPTYILVFIFGLYYAVNNFSFINQFSDTTSLIFTIIEIFLVAYLITRVVNVVFTWYKEKRTKKKMSEHILYVLKGVINFLVYLFAFLFILYVGQVDLTGAMVGLGVGGIAIAFALQNVLSDFFSAFSIYFDKPFEIGDFIVVGDYSGTVIKIGMKSTRVQLLQGEELILANSELTKASVRNYKKMKKRRISFSFGVTYDTPTNKLKKIPDIIKKIIDGNKLEYVDRLDRVHFTKFDDFCLNFDVVYYLKTKDYVKYMDTQQEINYAIKEEFEKIGVEMAFPTQTIILNK